MGAGVGEGCVVGVGRGLRSLVEKMVAVIAAPEAAEAAAMSARVVFDIIVESEWWTV